jgi:hypothetical protein
MDSSDGKRSAKRQNEQGSTFSGFYRARIPRRNTLMERDYLMTTLTPTIAEGLNLLRAKAAPGLLTKVLSRMLTRQSSDWTHEEHEMLNFIELAYYFDEEKNF